MKLKKAGVLLAAAAAAYGAYRYLKMTPEQKKDLKTKGRRLLKRDAGENKEMKKKKNIPIAGFAY